MRSRIGIALSFASSLLAISLVPTVGSAQDKSFKDLIIGAWIITSVSDNYDNGQKRDNWGGAVGGQITFGRTGRFTQIIVGPQMAAMKSDDPASRMHSLSPTTARTRSMKPKRQSLEKSSERLTQRERAVLKSGRSKEAVTRTS